MCDIKPISTVFKSENTKLVSNLRKLKFDNKCPSYYKTLPKGKTFSDEFYKSVKFINTLTIIGNNIYKSLPNNSEDKKFLEFFMANCFQSEEFIWNTPGIIQSYYYEGIQWQRGTLVDKSLDEYSIIPILSSSVGDCIIALILKYTNTPNTVFWLGQEQQNFLSMKFFTNDWSWIVETYSNPTVFINKDSHTTTINPHKLILGPTTWLAMSRDVISWNLIKNKDTFQEYITIGKKIWNKVNTHIHINRELINKLPEYIPLDNIFTNSINNIVGRYILCFINNDDYNGIFANYFNNSNERYRLPTVNNSDSVKILIDFIKNNDICSPTNNINKLSIINADEALNNLNISLNYAIHSKTDENYRYNLKIAYKHIQCFYCNSFCKKCVFIDPKVICA